MQATQILKADWVTIQSMSDDALLAPATNFGFAQFPTLVIDATGLRGFCLGEIMEDRSTWDIMIADSRVAVGAIGFSLQASWALMGARLATGLAHLLPMLALCSCPG